LPIDVEIGRVSGAGSVFEHVHPPFVEWSGDAHMVRDKIEYLAHRMRMHLPDPGIIIFARADRRVEVVVIGDVVAVQTIGARLKIRRSVHVAYSQRIEVWDNLAGLRKREPAVELQSVGAGWNARMVCGHSCNFLSFRAKSRNPVAKPKGYSLGSFDFASLRSG